MARPDASSASRADRSLSVRENDDEDDVSQLAVSDFTWVCKVKR